MVCNLCTPVYEFRRRLVCCLNRAGASCLSICIDSTCAELKSDSAHPAVCCDVLCCAVQESPRWQVVLRALAALEAILQRGSTQACGEVAVMFQSDPSPVRNTLSSPQVGHGSSG